MTDEQKKALAIDFCNENSLCQAEKVEKSKIEPFYGKIINWNCYKIHVSIVCIKNKTYQAVNNETCIHKIWHF